MRKLSVLVFALILVLSLAACGGNDALNGGEVAVSTPDTTNAPQDMTSANGNDIPLIDAPPIDSHEGDGQYFAPTSPNYFITMQNISGSVSLTKEAAWEEYHLYSFEEDVCTTAIKKIVFESAEDAATYRDLFYFSSGRYTDEVLAMIGNVLFVYDELMRSSLGKPAEGLRIYYPPEDIVYDSMV